MRIYSKFHDYYDPLLNMYQSELLPIYKRNADMIRGGLKGITLVDFLDYCVTESRQYKNKIQEIVLDKIGVVGFCGKLYPFVKKTVKYDNWDLKDEVRYIYDSKELDDLNKNNTLLPRYTYNGTKRNTYKHTFQYILNNKSVHKLFEVHKVPIFTIVFMNGYELTINDKLRDVGFQSIIEPYTAIQELHMYLNNILVSETQGTVPTGSDDDIMRSKGFYEYSFKNLPKKKK